ncbi:MAG TPA: Calx-beta domain-containing protein, partial [Gemmataceae bacterium]|nr:Calx-beta domain-containing protein [Gemmataceae bacterium]
MWFRNPLPSRKSASNRTTVRRPPARLALEALDEKAVPATLSIGDTSIVEGDSGTQMAALRVTLSGPVHPPVKVSYSTANGSALAGSDYQALTGTLTFNKGQTVRTILVPVMGDVLGEPDETFTVNLRNARRATIADGQGVVTILTDEPVMRIEGASASEGDAGSTAMTFKVTLSVPPSDPVSVDFTTADSGAAAGSDYVATNGTLNFAPGETEKLITVMVNGDQTLEFDESFRVNLSNVSGAQLATSSASGMIMNDDPGSFVTIDDQYVWEYGGVMAFTVTLSQASTETVTIDFNTVDGWATAGWDYGYNSGTLT